MSIYNTGTGTAFTNMGDINVYDNEVLEIKIKDALNTALNLQQFATVDYSLTAAPGMKIKIRTYTPEGQAERLAMGQANTTYVGSDFTEAEYRVDTLQATGKYFDEQVMADPRAIDTAIGMIPQAITNKLNQEVLVQMELATLRDASWTPTAANVLAALAEFPDDEVLTANGKFILCNNKTYLKLIKDAIANSLYVKDNTNTNSLGSVAGVPIYVSKLVADNVAYLGSRDAVTIFTKKSYGIESDRDIEHRGVTMVANLVNTVALTDAKKIMRLGPATSGYTLLTAEPADWDDNFNDYFHIDNGNMVKNSYDKKPTFAANTFYKLALD